MVRQVPGKPERRKCYRDGPRLACSVLSPVTFSGPGAGPLVWFSNLPFLAKNARKGLCQFPGGAMFDMVAAGDNLIGVKLLFDTMKQVV
jgi:hypothetical protein